MLISLDYLIRKYDLKIKGVLSIGSHYLEEYEDYKRAGIKRIIAFEPCKDAYGVMTKKFQEKPYGTSIQEMSFYNIALGEKEEKSEMYVSKQNQGQSNSLRKPILHLEQHPDIIFTEKELVSVKTLDSIVFEREKYNMINADAQGNEGDIFKGATETLKHIDIIYTEVNRAEVYENCMQVDELDVLLTDFIRVETKWVGNWGDSLYLSKKVLND